MTFPTQQQRPESRPGWDGALARAHGTDETTNHFMNIASRAFAFGEIAKEIGNRGATILEIGCSSGALLRELSSAFPANSYIGTEYSEELIAGLRSTLPGVKFLVLDLKQSDFPSSSVDAVIILNVLEHVEDDKTAMASIARILKPGGVAVIEVPAGPLLFDGYDLALMHFRRYRMSGLLRLCADAGFSVVRRSHNGFLIFPAFAATKLFNRAFRRTVSADDFNSTTAAASPMVNPIMLFEGWLRDRVYLPFGVRCLLTCRK